MVYWGKIGVDIPKYNRGNIELDLISLLVNFLCELGQIMTKYDFLGAR